MIVLRDFGSGELLRKAASPVPENKWFGVCVSVPACETTRVSCVCGEHLGVCEEWLGRRPGDAASKTSPPRAVVLGFRPASVRAPISRLWSRVRTALERFTSAAMLRLRSHWCAPPSAVVLDSFPGESARCVRWHFAPGATTLLCEVWAPLRLCSFSSLSGPGLRAGRVRSHRRRGPGRIM